ncbi:MAG: tyrosine-type recombinase/integrase, partial [Bacteroidota bacterium]|nr:tyrosine-type recombinase/integrase [Bacteroidota bacterium]
EVKRLLKAPEHIREKVMFGLTYDTGLRINELISLLIRDVHLDRGQVHIRQTKNKKDRYVTMSSHAVRGIKKHITLNRPKTYLFESPKQTTLIYLHIAQVDPAKRFGCMEALYEKGDG